MQKNVLEFCIDTFSAEVLRSVLPGFFSPSKVKLVWCNPKRDKKMCMGLPNVAKDKHFLQKPFSYIINYLTLLCIQYKNNIEIHNFLSKYISL